MSVGPLVSTADLAARLGTTLTDAQAARATALIADASAKVRAWCRAGGVEFELVEDEQVWVASTGATLLLPRRPVTAVTDVATIDGTAVPSASWEWNHRDKVRLLLAQVDPEYRVTLSSGYPEIPVDVVAVTCAMVLRVLTAPSATEGLGGEQIGQYSYQAPSGSAGVSVRMLRSDQDDLRAAGFGPPRAGTIMVRAW